MKYLRDFLVILMISALGLTAAEENYGLNGKSLSPKIRKYLDNAFTVREVQGNFQLKNGIVVQSNLFVVDADADIEGVIEGNLVVLNSDICLEDEAVLYGDLVLINSELDDEGGQIYGEIITMEDGRLSSRVKRKAVGPVSWSFNEQTGMSELQFGHVPQKLTFVHNRVQGFFFGLKWPNILGYQVKWINLNAKIGYGFSDQIWRYQIGAKRAIGESPLFVGISGYDQVDSYDKWKITEFENTLASFTFMEDFFDYFVRRGWQFDISYETIPFKLMAGYRNENQETAYKSTSWALFNLDKKFRYNPVANEGKYNILFVRGTVTTIDNNKNPHSGIHIMGTGESSSGAIGSDYFYNSAELTFISYIPLSKAETIGLRLYGGSLEGIDAPNQRYFRTGGLGTVRGFSLNSQYGNRSLLATLEYKLSLIEFDDNLWFLDNWGIAAFTDVGSTINVDGALGWYEGFEEFDINSNIQNSFGLGFILGSETGRIDIVKRTDRGANAIAAYIRLKVNF